MPLRWLLASLAALGAFFIAGIGGSIATSLLGFWHLPGAGFSAAAAVVLAAYLAAPSHKLLFSFGVFVLGALAAWFILTPSWYPESYEGLAYQPTHIPLIATYAGGLLSLCIAIWHRARIGAGA